LKTDPPSRERPTYSTRLLQPFVDVQEEYEHVPDLGQGLLESLGDRVLVEVANQALSLAVAQTGDPDLGLKAARRLVLGTAGAVDYVLSASPTVREAVEHAARYMPLVNEALSVRLELDGALAIVRLESSVVLPRAAVDFEVGGFFRNHINEWLRDWLEALTVSFTHQQPDDLAEYERTFGPAALRFSAPFVGFSFDRGFLDLPLKGADSNLLAVMVPLADQTLGQRVPARSVTADVRRMIVDNLRLGTPDIAEVASSLAMSMRTLARRLESEGTTFRELIDDERRRLALEYVGSRDLAFSEIAQLLGFSHAAAFHRAFRRWTGQTPLAYRRAAGR
jgi:AraC-like DNA-binding protein